MATDLDPGCSLDLCYADPIGGWRRHGERLRQVLPPQFGAAKIRDNREASRADERGSVVARHAEYERLTDRGDVPGDRRQDGLLVAKRALGEVVEYDPAAARGIGGDRAQGRIDARLRYVHRHPLPDEQRGFGGIVTGALQHGGEILRREIDRRVGDMRG